MSFIIRTIFLGAIFLCVGIIVTEIVVKLTEYPEEKISEEAKKDIDKAIKSLVMCRGAPIGNLLFRKRKLEHVEKTTTSDHMNAIPQEHKEMFGKTHDITFSFYTLFGIKGEEIIYFANYDCQRVLDSG